MQQPEKIKTKFCWCCGESKIYTDYYLNRGIPEKFCKSCCKSYSGKERQSREYRMIFGIVTNTKGEIWEKKF